LKFILAVHSDPKYNSKRPYILRASVVENATQKLETKIMLKKNAEIPLKRISRPITEDYWNDTVTG